MCGLIFIVKIRAYFSPFQKMKSKRRKLKEKIEEKLRQFFEILRPCEGCKFPKLNYFSPFYFIYFFHRRKRNNSEKEFFSGNTVNILLQRILMKWTNK